MTDPDGKQVTIPEGISGGFLTEHWDVFMRSSSPICVLDDERRFVEVNQATSTMLETDRKALIGMRIDDFTSSKRLPALREQWKMLMANGAVSGIYETTLASGATWKARYSGVRGAVNGMHAFVTIAMLDPSEADDAAEPRPRPLSVVTVGAEIATSLLAAALDAAGVDVLARAADRNEALSQLAELRPNVILDVPEPRRDAAVTRAVTDAYAQACPGVGVVVGSLTSSAQHAKDALDAGANAYITRSDDMEHLIAAVRAAAVSEKYVSPALGAEIIRLGRSRDSELSERELRVLKGTALGYTNREIAEAMGVSLRTVETHRSSVNRKLGFKRRADLVIHALEHGILRPGVRTIEDE